MANSYSECAPIYVSEKDLLNLVANFITKELKDIDFSAVVIDIFISARRSHSFVASYISADGLSQQNVRFGYEASSELDSIFIDLHEIMSNGAGIPQWNKARVTFLKDSNDCSMVHYMDPDFDWLEGLDPESHEYLQLDVNEELGILTWEGLPKWHPRPWSEHRQR